ncbi:uncharacterized protein EV420DRAFT_1484975 [Desarmillaria tabescens]|uniref:Uncharacterized protein n=1 Tax=Armillaria tabescens TaxID=1929756 RepID=A0AA39MRL1_ARMTA|nr:uncharacterized protein EV420DRAFT_1484975 [Desarmillaria tabescens]KAK0443449.1 hypothetical protein EV420DRAFT_1484975 [Desarmillaria tabescens]
MNERETEEMDGTPTWWPAEDCSSKLARRTSDQDKSNPVILLNAPQHLFKTSIKHGTSFPKTININRILSQSYISTFLFAFLGPRRWYRKGRRDRVNSDEVNALFDWVGLMDDVMMAKKNDYARRANVSTCSQDSTSYGRTLPNSTSSPTTNRIPAMKPISSTTCATPTDPPPAGSPLPETTFTITSIFQCYRLLAVSKRNLSGSGEARCSLNTEPKYLGWMSTMANLCILYSCIWTTTGTLDEIHSIDFDLRPVNLTADDLAPSDNPSKMLSYIWKACENGFLDEGDDTQILRLACCRGQGRRPQLDAMRTRSTLTVWDIARTSRVWRYRCMVSALAVDILGRPARARLKRRAVRPLHPSHLHRTHHPSPLNAPPSTSTLRSPRPVVFAPTSTSTIPHHFDGSENDNTGASRRERQYASIHTFVPWEEHDSGKAPIAVLFPGQLMAA